MLVKSTLCVNLTYILPAAFCMKVFCKDFLYLRFGFVNFWQKNIGSKAACKILVKIATAGPHLKFLTLKGCEMG